ncbi:hypothetical protein JAAARDRAFT_32137 [Jaapia argillacea MUCL 33604]|uniref:GATA-type domain-containing protein n=1 Tax=Jaapia argillacea MUCL 33604 TaxID=933084 RepID=A0A067QCA4_9AGAM|nr:hypothetical protein JAAARDRAFT_32137 [Jaapia argillacea MUCL 33604]
MATAVVQVAPGIEPSMSGSASSSSNAVAGPSNQLQSAQKQPVFEFTRRKRWADLLVTELTEAIIFVLSPSCKVWFCGNAVTELLGWRDDELVDTDLTELMNVDDRGNFVRAFNTSLHSRQDLLSYVRLKYKSEPRHDSRDYNTAPKEVLFEMKGYSHFVPEEDGCQCFFAMARPYPSRNTAMLNTFLELKMENERLQQRLRELRARSAQNYALGTPSSSSTSGYPGYSIPMPVSVPISSQSATQPYYALPGSRGVGGYDDLIPSPVQGNFDPSARTGYRGMYGSNPIAVPANVEEDVGEDGSKKKKAKKSHIGEQYVCVTCGRTDSPEWRKGPMGPKTLCNACGLRWAKQQRKTDGDPADGGGEGSQGQIVGHSYS